MVRNGLPLLSPWRGSSPVPGARRAAPAFGAPLPRELACAGATRAGQPWSAAPAALTRATQEAEQLTGRGSRPAMAVPGAPLATRPPPAAAMSSAAAAPEPRPVRFGILGCTTIARKVARAMLLAPDAAVAAVGSRSEEKARLFAADNGLIPAADDGLRLRLHGTYEALLDDPGVDAVYLPLPTSLHVRWAAAAAARGKHVLLEKPAALCAADLDAVLAACDAAGVQFMDATMLMHHPRTAKMQEVVHDKDAFGDVKLKKK